MLSARPSWTSNPVCAHACTASQRALHNPREAPSSDAALRVEAHVAGGAAAETAPDRRNLCPGQAPRHARRNPDRQRRVDQTWAGQHRARVAADPPPGRAKGAPDRLRALSVPGQPPPELPHAIIVDPFAACGGRSRPTSTLSANMKSNLECLDPVIDTGLKAPPAIVEADRSTHLPHPAHPCSNVDTDDGRGPAAGRRWSRGRRGSTCWHPRFTATGSTSGPACARQDNTGGVSGRRRYRLQFDRGPARHSRRGFRQVPGHHVLQDVYPALRDDEAAPDRLGGAADRRAAPPARRGAIVDTEACVHSIGPARAV